MIDAKTLGWMRLQITGPRVAYTVKEWALLSGFEPRWLREEFIRRKIITKRANEIDGSRTRRRRHTIDLDDAVRHWPGLWSGIVRRVMEIGRRQSSAA